MRILSSNSAGKLLAAAFLFYSVEKTTAQNIAINTDGTTAEAGVMLDVKGANSKTGAVEKAFQIKSNDAVGSELKLRLVLGNNATAGSRYGSISVEDYPGPTYRAFLIQPSGGNVGIGTTNPTCLLDATLNQNNYTLAAIRNGNNGGNACSGFICYNDNASSNATFGLTSTAWSFPGYSIFGLNRLFINANSGTNGMVMNTEGAQPILFSTGFTERMRVDGNGNVGIGTSSPARPLEISTGQLRFSNNLGDIEFTEVADLIGRATTASPNATDAVMRVFTSSAATELFRIQHNGYTGIGTSVPASNLEIASTTQLISRLKFSGQEFYQAANTSTDGVAFVLGVNRANNRQLWIGESDKLAQNNTNLVIRIMPFTTLYNAGVIDVLSTDASTTKNLLLNPWGGNIGIGTGGTAPSSKLEVYTNSSGGIRAYGPVTNVSGMIQVRDNDDGAADPWPGGAHVVIWPNNNGLGILRFVKSGISQFDFVDRSTVNTAAGRRFAIHDANGVGDIMTFWGNGYVGIGTSTPGYKLDVQGDLNVCGVIHYTGFSAGCSDIRYKKDISPLANALHNVLKLQGVNYFWKTKEFPEKQFSETKQIGFIAQEIEKIFPEVVFTDKDGYKSVDYSRLTPVLVEAIKEQQTKIDALEKTVAELVKITSSQANENLRGSR